jgi:Flp pilus assembly protein TadD
MKLAPTLSAGLMLFVAACGFDKFETAGNSYTAAVRDADAARQAGDFQTALPLYGRALEANPQGVEAHLGLGQSYLTLGANDEAAAQFRMALAARKGDPTALRGLAAALISMGQPTLAQQQLQMALQSDPKDYRAINALGVALDMEGHHQDAQAEYREGIAIAPEFLPLRTNFGLSLAITDQATDAVAQLLPIATGSRSDVRDRQNLAFAYVMAGDPTNALLVSRHDLTEPAAQQQLSYYLRLKALPVDQRSAEIRRNPSFFPITTPGGVGIGGGKGSGT